MKSRMELEQVEERERPLRAGVDDDDYDVDELADWYWDEEDEE